MLTNFSFWVLVMEQTRADTPDLPPLTETMAWTQYLYLGAAALDLATTNLLCASLSP